MEATRQGPQGKGLPRLETKKSSVSDRGLVAHPLKMSFVAQVLGILQRGLAIVLEGSIVILAYLRLLSTLVPCLGGLRLRRDGREENGSGEEKEQRERLKRVCR